jgi:hypothetical protein
VIEQSHPITHLNPGPRHILVNASLKEATNLFPPFISNAIQRIPQAANETVFAADITMSLPVTIWDTYECQMTIGVAENKVERIARHLFGVDLETTTGLRYVCHPGGGRLLPNPELTISDCRDNVIEELFGEEIFNAIKGSVLYQDEVKQMLHYTKCVSMVISVQADRGAQLCISLGLMEATRIRAKLYD